MKITPSWLPTLIPPHVLDAIIALDNIQKTWGISSQKLAEYIEVGKAVPYPVVEVVAGLASGNLIAENGKLYGREVYEQFTGKKPPIQPAASPPEHDKPKIITMNGKGKIYGPDGKPI